MSYILSFSLKFLSLPHNFSTTAQLTFGIDNSVYCVAVLCADVYFEASLASSTGCQQQFPPSPPPFPSDPGSAECHLVLLINSDILVELSDKL